MEPEMLETDDTWCCPACYESGSVQLTTAKTDLGEYIIRCAVCQAIVGSLREEDI